jgi:uncharacterized protein YsxB (DUF464 family)|tara:strand:- start:22478 stop:23695 length:1218 start_codon:yes stop_codon:yes gene_type:complete
MANTLTTVNPEIWAREAERSLFVENKAMAIANMTLRNLVAGEGDQVNRQILSYPASSTYTPGTDITNLNITSAQESLSIATWFASKVTIDDTEKVQSIIQLVQNVTKKMMKDLNNRIEQVVTNETSNAQWSLDAANVGGTAGSNISVNTDNIPQIFIAADTKLDATDAPTAGRTAVIGGHVLGTLKLQQAARGTVFSDGVNTRGVVTSLFGWDILYSNNLPYSATLGLATNPTATDTVTIAGVAFTFVATLATAGDVHICSSASATVTNFVNALNSPATAIAEASNTGYTPVSAENAFLLRDKRRLTATDNTTSIGITGYGDIVVAETFTDGTDAWSAQLQKSLFTIAGSVDIIVQIPPKIEVVRDPDQFSDIVKSLLGYGVKTFADGAREMVYVKVDASTSDWS